MVSYGLAERLTPGGALCKDAGDFAAFVQTLQKMGVQHTIRWQLPKEKWQKRLDDLGYNMTSLACCEVLIDNTNTGFVFFNGRDGKFMFTTTHNNGDLSSDDVTVHISPENPVFLINEDE